VDNVLGGGIPDYSFNLIGGPTLYFTVLGQSAITARQRGSSSQKH
jgi:hypothetical protein